MNHSDTVLRLVSQNFYDDISWTIYLLFLLTNFLTVLGIKSRVLYIALKILPWSLLPALN